MRNSILMGCIFFLAACGFEYDHNAYVNKAGVNDLLKSAYGSIEIDKEGKVKILASKNYAISVLKDLATRNNYKMSVIWNRKSTALTYKADKTYDIEVHPGNSFQEGNSNILSTIEIYSAITFGSEKPSETFKTQLKKAFEEEQKKHDPMKHVDATYVVNMKLDDVKVKFEAFLRKLYPKGVFTPVTINGKSYQVVSVVRSAGNVVTTADYFYYTFKNVAAGQTEVQLHTATGSGTQAGGLITNASKEKSQEVLDIIVKKLGF